MRGNIVMGSGRVGRTVSVLSALVTAVVCLTVPVTASAHDGVVDTAFGTRGTTVLPESHHGVTGSNNPFAHVLATSHGRIWVGGVQYDKTEFAAQDYVMRLTSGGRADSTFHGGTPYWRFKMSEFAGTTTIVPEPDGGAVVATFEESCCPDGDVDFTRLTRSGTVDHGWASSGHHPFAPAECRGENCVPKITSGVRLSDGRLRFGGYLGQCACSTAFLLGLTATGASDLGVGPDGRRTPAAAVPKDADHLNSQIVALAADSSDRLYLLYSDTFGPDAGHQQWGLRVLRTDANGNADPTYGDHGEVAVTIPSGVTHYINVGDQQPTMKVSPSGELYLGFSSRTAFSTKNERAVLTHLRANGSTDTRFGTQGFVAFHSSVAGGQGWLTAIGTDGKGHLLLGLTYGHPDSGGHLSTSHLLMRISAITGIVDTGFGTKGAVGSASVVLGIARVSSTRLVTLGWRTPTSGVGAIGPSRLQAFKG